MNFTGFEGCAMVVFYRYDLGGARLKQYSFLEFFAGGGMARMGLGPHWQCLLANDIDPKKAAAYQVNWEQDHFHLGDIGDMSHHRMPHQADLAWASFPCQDLSLAGKGRGLKGERSGTFWHFDRIIGELRHAGRAPHVIVLENVCGALSSHEGKDFADICAALKRQNYQYGAVVIDAVHFVPQSRPRLFIIGVQAALKAPHHLICTEPEQWHTPAVVQAYRRLPEILKNNWIWWRLGPAPRRTINFIDLMEDNPKDVKWDSPAETRRILNMMTPVNLKKVEAEKEKGKPAIGGLYKRTREGIQRAEVRFDVSGCLRTPGGGSSRQRIIFVNGGKVSTRLLSKREAARLMGLPDEYKLPTRYNDSYHLIGDGLVVPVVSFVENKILRPLLDHNFMKGDAEDAVDHRTNRELEPVL